MSIGVFDSGVGGLSILRALRQQLPLASMTYVGDVSHSPYGERPAHEVLARCFAIVEHLVAQGSTLIVVACNTATVLGIEHLRQRWPQLVFVGVEPGVKPAALWSKSKRIALMVTPATALSARLRWLIEQHAMGVHVHVQACAGLAGAIERGELQGAQLLSVLRPCCEPICHADVDTVVLGCTHYPFVAQEIQTLLGMDIQLLDTAVAVARRVAQLWRASTALDHPAIRIFSTGATAGMQCLLRSCAGLTDLKVDELTS
jgi:glutamate racemase